MKRGSKELVDQTLLIFAFRYALGRTSTAPSIVVDTLLEHIEELSDTVLECLTYDADEGPILGMDCDKEQWSKLQDSAKAEIERRSGFIG